MRGCCAIMIFHPTRSAILHWDDNICHLELRKFVNEFTKDSLPLSDCDVHLVGGWRDHTESRASCLFLKEFFELSNAKLILEHFMKKKSTGTLSQQGFSLVSIDSRNGSVSALSDWSKLLLNYADGKFRGASDPAHRHINLKLISVYHLQSVQDSSSGNRIYSRDKFSEIQESEATGLCLAAKANNIEQLIKIIDEGITNVNVAPAHAKGWAPLHYACKL